MARYVEFGRKRRGQLHACASPGYELRELDAFQRHGGFNQCLKKRLDTPGSTRKPERAVGVAGVTVTHDAHDA
jgi:hypothetical protein